MCYTLHKEYVSFTFKYNNTFMIIAKLVWIRNFYVNEFNFIYIYICEYFFLILCNLSLFLPLFDSCVSLNVMSLIMSIGGRSLKLCNVEPHNPPVCPNAWKGKTEHEKWLSILISLRWRRCCWCENVCFLMNVFVRKIVYQDFDILVSKYII